MSELFGTTDDVEPDEEVKQKTFDSQPVTAEEMAKLSEGFYQQDLNGGLQNIEVPEEELDRQREEQDYANSFIDRKDDVGVPCYRTDQVHLTLTPEQLVVLKEALEALSLNMEPLNYLTEYRDKELLYEHQTYVRMLHDIVDGTLNEYVKHRPFSPFLPTWFKKIGKTNVVEKDV